MMTSDLPHGNGTSHPKEDDMPVDTLYVGENGEMLLVESGTPPPPVLAETFPVISPLATRNMFTGRPQQGPDGAPPAYSAVQKSVSDDLEELKALGCRYDLRPTDDGAGFHCTILDGDLVQSACCWWAFATDEASAEALWRMIECRHDEWRHARPDHPYLPFKPSTLPWLYYDSACLDAATRVDIEEVLPVMLKAAWTWLFKRELGLAQDDSGQAASNGPNKVEHYARPEQAAPRETHPRAPSKARKPTQALVVASPALQGHHLVSPRISFAPHEITLNSHLARYDFWARYENAPEFHRYYDVEFIHAPDDWGFVLKLRGKGMKSAPWSTWYLAADEASARKLGRRFKHLRRGMKRVHAEGARLGAKPSALAWLYFDRLPATSALTPWSVSPSGLLKWMMTMSWFWIDWREASLSD